MTCHLGDFEEYAALRRRLSDRERELTRSGAARRRAQAAESLATLRVGDVIFVPTGRHTGPAVVLDPGLRDPGDEPRPFVLTIDRQVKRLSIVDFNAPVTSVARLRIPAHFSARSAHSRRDLANALREKVKGVPHPHPRRSGGRSTAADDDEVRDLRAQLRHHPCHGCDERDDHARWAERYWRLHHETEGLTRRVENRTNSLARQFDRVCALLTRLGYLQGSGERTVVTPEGRTLMRLYSESDLLAAECLRRGTWSGLSAPELAAACSALVYESRNPEDPAPPRLPGGAHLREALLATTRLWGELDELEKEHHLGFLREPDLGFAQAAYRWASGARLEPVLLDADMAAGDFVRWCKQLIDMLGQVADAARGHDEALARTAGEAAEAVRRGVVAYSSV